MPKSRAGALLESALEDLQRISNLESLRPYIAHEGCFLQNSNHDTAQITIEELKRLTRLWKLDHGKDLTSNLY